MASVVHEIELLFSPITIAGVTLKNRFVMPAMQRGWCKDGAPLPELADYYRRRIQGGVALVIGESCAIDHPSATAQLGACRLDPSTQASWGHCVEAVRGAGGQMLIQLWHEGALRNDADGLTLSPSGLGHAGLERGHAASLGELDELLESYVRSALRAQAIGATGIELHCAHGYLLDQFLWPVTNQRTDGYGGASITDRARFPTAIVAGIRSACGPDFLISLRFSQWKEHDYQAKITSTATELNSLLHLLRDAGVDILHASTRRFWEPEWPTDPRTLAGWTRSLSGLPTIAVGSVGLDRDVMQSFTEGGEAGETIRESLDHLRTGSAQGQFDMIAIGRSLIGDPDFVNKIAHGQQDRIRPFRKADVAAVEWEF
jgi:2,4-dienoyl-CoA reductase-like NADH-dependent reductase (Old Yellow Enzyme family)